MYNVDKILYIKGISRTAVCVRVHMYVYIYIFICIDICVYIYIYKYTLGKETRTMTFGNML